MMRRHPPSFRGGAALLAAIMVLGAILSAGVVASSAATVFSREGYGWWWDQGDPAALGRGGTSVAVTGYGATGEVNPAVTAGARIPYGYGAWSGEVATAKADAGSFRHRSDILPHLGGVVVLPHGLRAMGVLRVQTDGSFERTQQLSSPTGGAFTLDTKGEGGWNRLEVGLSGPALRERILWGAAVSRIMGTVRETWSYAFEESGTARIRNEIDARLGGGWMGTVGLVLRPDPRFTIGGSGTLGGSSRVVQEVRTLEGGAYDASTHARQDLPSQWAVGASATFVPRLTLSGDLVRRLWGTASYRPSDGAATDPWRDTSRWGVGLEYTGPVGANAPAPALPRWVLRGGFMQDEYYVAAVDGSRVKESAGTVGGSIRTGHGRAALDLGLQIGKRGDRAKVGVEETFWRLNVGITFSSVVRPY